MLENRIDSDCFLLINILKSSIAFFYPLWGHVPQQKHLLFTKNESKRGIIHSGSRHPSANTDTLTKISLL